MSVSTNKVQNWEVSICVPHTAAQLIVSTPDHAPLLLNLQLSLLFLTWIMTLLCTCFCTLTMRHHLGVHMIKMVRSGQARTDKIQAFVMYQWHRKNNIQRSEECLFLSVLTALCIFIQPQYPSFMVVTKNLYLICAFPRSTQRTQRPLTRSDYGVQNCSSHTDIIFILNSYLSSIADLMVWALSREGWWMIF